jgi:hypothetical protein
VTTEELKAAIVVHLIGVLRGEPWPTTINAFCKTTGCHNWTQASDALREMADNDLIAVFRWVGGTPLRVPSAEMDATLFHSDFAIAPTQKAVSLYNSLRGKL